LVPHFKLKFLFAEAGDGQAQRINIRQRECGRNHGATV